MIMNTDISNDNIKIDINSPHRSDISSDLCVLNRTDEKNISLLNLDFKSSYYENIIENSEPSDTNSEDMNDIKDFNNINFKNRYTDSPCKYEIEYSNNTNKTIRYKKLSYNAVRRQINSSYEQDAIHRYSSALDILASYLKGQKTIYMESRNYTCTILKFNVSAIFLSALVSLIQSESISNYQVGRIILAGISAFVAFLLSITSL